MPHAASSRRSAVKSRATHSTAPSSVSISPPQRRYHVKGDTNVAIRLRKGITVNNHTGAFEDDDDFTDEDSAGIQVVSASEDEYTTSEATDEEDDEEDEEGEEDDDDDEEDEDDDEEGSWDYLSLIHI